MHNTNSVSMTKIKCPRQDCRKEFEKPVLVTNFSFTPTKETYQACPYCLTRIDKNATTCNCTTVVVEPIIEANPEKQETKETCIKEGLQDSATIEKIGTLEKQKADLLAEVEKLKKGATKKINKLEEEIAALKEEKQALEQITN